MAVRKLKPDTPSRRYMSISSFEEITKSKPERKLTNALRKTGGRNNFGRITSRRRGGGHKRRYRMIDFKRNKFDMQATIIAIEYDPNRSPRIALLQYKDNAIAYTIGRHTNDYMTSFYSITPSGFFVENGWGGRIIDPSTWKPIETFEGPSFWGHERLYLPKEERMKFRNKRMETAAEGNQAPLLIDCPWLYTNITNKK